MPLKTSQTLRVRGGPAEYWARGPAGCRPTGISSVPVPPRLGLVVNYWSQAHRAALAPPPLSRLWAPPRYVGVLRRDPRAFAARIVGPEPPRLLTRTESLQSP